MRPQPLLAVSDVEASSRWFQHLLGAQSAHGGVEYERLTVDGEPGGPAHREVWIRDPNGYTVVLASPDGEAA